MNMETAGMGTFEDLAVLQREFGAMRKVIEELRTELKTVREENNEQKKRIVELEDRVDYMDNQSRRENLVIRGIPEEKGETKEMCEEEVIKLAEQIGVELTKSDFSRAHPCAE